MPDFPIALVCIKWEHKYIVFGKTNQYCFLLWFGVYLLALTSTKAYTLIIYILFSDTFFSLFIEIYAVSEYISH